jgi:uncharacterized protein
MLQYEVPAGMLEPWLPVGVELDRWQGKVLVSLVGFRFLDTRVMGVPVPGHRDFDEVNLRFYVRRKEAGEWRRGVVFVRELVPRPLIAWVARVVYDEPYRAVPMSHEIVMEDGVPGAVEYGWRMDGKACRLRVETEGNWRGLQSGEEAEFITEHYWGYTKRRDGSTSEYEVEHPSWRVMDVSQASFSAPVELLYGREFAEYLQGDPVSALLAEGSRVSVYPGKRLS